MHEAIIFSNDDQHLPQLRDALHKNPEHIDALDGAGNTPLHWAVERRDLGSARLLLDFGADVNCKGPRGNTPLYLAALCGQEALVQLFIEQGADVVNVGADSILASVMSEKTSATVTAMLLAHGVDPNTRSQLSGHGALHSMTGNFRNPLYQHESIQKLDRLLAAGANINQPTFAGQSPLVFAGWRDDAAYTRLLLQRGADVGLTDTDGRGLLHCMALRGTRESMETVRLHHSDSDDQEYPLDVGAKDNNGVTAVEYFKRRVEAMPQLPEKVGGSSLPKSSMKLVSREDIEEWVMLIEDLQSCRRHVHTKDQ